MATKKAAAKKVALVADAQKPAASPAAAESAAPTNGSDAAAVNQDGMQAPAADSQAAAQDQPEGASLLSTGGDFTPPPADPEPPAAPPPAPIPESMPVDDPGKTLAVRFGSEPREAKILAIAKVCHEANRALCEAFGDHSQVAWEEAEDWQRDSAIKGVEYTIANPDLTPADQHAAWCRDKIAAGWAYGPVKDVRNKQHDCLVAYELLPPKQQAKDHVFRAIVRAMLPG